MSVGVWTLIAFKITSTTIRFISACLEPAVGWRGVGGGEGRGSQKKKLWFGIVRCSFGGVRSRRRGRVGAGEERGGVSAGWSLSGGGAGREVGGGDRLKRVSKHDIPVLTPQLFRGGAKKKKQPSGLRNAPPFGSVWGNAEAAGERFFSLLFIYFIGSQPGNARKRG